jgi:F-type H+-transporting ATPase subunit delta
MIKTLKILNKKIVLTYTEDPGLLGGMVAQVGGWNFDETIEKHLKRMSDELNRRVN